MNKPVARMLKLDPRKLPAQVFQRYAARAGIIRDRQEREAKAWESFGIPGIDPNSVG